MTRIQTILGAAAAALLIGAAMPTSAPASSHSEAPSTVRDRLADDTDLYAWVAADAPNSVTIVGDWVPLIEPASGPNFAAWDEAVSYYINVDNVGDAQDHVRFQFRFTTTRRNESTFLYNTGVVTSLDDPDLNVRQTYTLTRYDDGVPTVLISGVPVAPNYVGPTSMPDYASLAQAAVQTLSDGTKVFVGPRDDPFFVDLAAVFDLISLRRPPGNKGKGVDDLAGFDCLTIALQLPMTRITRDGMAPHSGNSVIGIYDSAARLATRTMNADGTISLSGEEMQVSRLGHPLVNEVVIPLQDKDLFCRTKPPGDGAFLKYVLDPEVATLLQAIYGVPKPPTPRNDLVAVFLTGIPGLTKPETPNQVPCEMLRLNLALAPASAPSRFGVLAGDVAGFPNGRRLSDDVVDIELRAVAGGYPLTPEFNSAPANQLGDGTDANDVPFLPYFPYVAPPHNPADHRHHMEQKGTTSQGAGAAERKAGERPSIGVAGSHPARELKLAYSLPRAGRVSLQIFDVNGRLVRTLLDQDAAAGDFVARWDGRNDSGRLLSRGVYFSRLDLSGQASSRKVILE